MWPPERTPAALLIDLDGTLADSHAALRRCFDSFLESYGIRSTDSAFRSFDGTPLSDVVRRLRRSHGLPGSDHALTEEYLASVERAYAHVSLAPGAAQLVRTARELGSVLVLVTSAPARLAEAFLSGAGMRESFIGVVSGEDCAAKPDPAPFTNALAYAGVAAPSALAVEDAPAGVASARAAGVDVVGISADRARRAALCDAGATATLSTLAELEGELRRAAARTFA